MNAGMKAVLKAAAERGITLYVVHLCGHYGLWRVVLGETTVEQATADLGARECVSCLNAKERGAEWAEE